MKTWVMAVLAVLVATSAQAQMGNLFKDFQNFIDAVSSQQPSGSRPAPSSQSSDAPERPQSGRNGLTPGQLCARIEGSPTIKRYVNQVATVQSKKMSSDALSRVIENKLDSSDGKLAKGVSDRFNQAVSLSKEQTMPGMEIQRSIESAIFSCAQKNANGDLFSFFASSADEVNATNRQRQGVLENRVTALNYAGDMPRLENRGTTLRLNSKWASMYAFAFSDAEDLVAPTSAEAVQEVDRLVAALEAERNKQVAQRKAEEEARRQEEEKRQADIQKYEAFRESPDGRLVFGYQYFQMIQTCHEMRKGNAIPFVNSADYADLTKRMKTIEGTLKPALQEKNTDKLWAIAAQRNQNWDPLEGWGYGSAGVRLDVIQTIKENNISNVTAAKKDCDHFLLEFTRLAEKVLGRESPKKNF